MIPLIITLGQVRITALLQKAVPVMKDGWIIALKCKFMLQNSKDTAADFHRFLKPIIQSIYLLFQM